ncbi:SusC/RagA family TonB-linked outer membrane protein [Paludibacter jiangxiensis]|uniref:Iron complex outermembrane recepter protein n=1 Tax=Paludibacter jiangxiensis TaxID=681398 RepID=A0A161LWR3_9BACT|nr:TonB-dependent receptor [Paludibacter jiangxiensis]GAT63692.1 iron complex outermembrane recepter protein [Paludibacter jiangxiensis]
MKNLNVLSTLPTRRWWTILLALLFAMSISAQTISVKGVVKDAKSGETIVGANVIVKGTTTGTVTDVNGNFSLNAPSNATLVVKYVGYQDAELPVAGKSNLVINLQESSIALSEVVAIGYGQVKKNDLTGSVVAVSTDKMNKGLATSFTDILSGKMAGVNISTSGGAPGAGATIRIRGGSSMSASNDPLIVVDNVPIEGSGVNGMSNPLSGINPQDIETFTVLKDASATAIYGSRASNGVILITTKKGSLKQKFAVSYDGSASVSTIAKKVDVLSADEFRTFVRDYWAGSPSVPALLGNFNTNWQDLIYKTAWGHDHNLSIAGAAGKLPYRVSVGYTNQDGILKTSNYSRTTASLSLNPTLLNDHLKVNANVKGSYSTNRFADTGAIGAALEFDPTQQIYSASKYGNNYFMWLKTDGTPQSLGTANPLSVLTEKRDVSYVYQSIGNLQLDYKFHAIPELRANLNLAYDISKSDGSTTINANSPISYVWGSKKNGAGSYAPYYQKKTNTLLDFYLDYAKTFGVHSIDLMGGYSWQHFFNTSWSSTVYTDNVANVPRVDYPTAYQLVSFFGRFNYTLMDRYLLTFTLRDDGTSRFSKDNRWGLFPSVALAWKMKEESFLKDVNWLSDLKLRLGYGQTGQQNLNISNDYPYIPTYNLSTYNDAQYLFGSQWYHLLRPSYFNTSLKWESTTTYNAGIDLGFLNNRITASVDVYKRVTDNMINVIPVAAGTNFINEMVTNIGSMENKGVEFTITGKPVVSRHFTWDLSYNLGYNKNEITKLTSSPDASYGVPGGDISGGTGNKIYIQKVGYPVNSYYVYKQVYDTKGNPIEGAYNNNATLYCDHSPAPDVTMGLSSRMNYKQWYLNFSMRASIGNYNYNNVQSSKEFKNQSFTTGSLKNLLSTSLDTNFKNAQYISDYYIQNASFAKMDNVTLGYNFDKFLASKLRASVYGTVQNVFTITKYKGLDPEVSNGIDNNIYPRPRVFIMGLRVNF